MISFMISVVLPNIETVSLNPGRPAIPLRNRFTGAVPALRPLRLGDARRGWSWAWSSGLSTLLSSTNAV